MNTFALGVRVDGVSAVRLRAAASGAWLSQKLLARVGAYVVDAARRRVDSGVGVDGRRIKPSQRSLAQSGQTLRDKGQMLGGYRARSVTKTSVTVGFAALNLAERAAYHQFGTAGPYRIPREGRRLLAWRGYGKEFIGRTKGGRVKNARALSPWRYAMFVMHPGLPPRPVFGISNLDRTNISKMAEAEAHKLMRGAR